MRPEFDSAAFADRLQQVIARQGLTMTRAAALCEIPLPTLEGYVYRQNLPGAKAMIKLVQGLGISADWLLLGEEAPGSISPPIERPAA